MEPYQREILEKAVRFYESVALPQSRSPEIRYETGRARFRVADIRYKFNQTEQAEAAYRAGPLDLRAAGGRLPGSGPSSPRQFAGNLNSLAILYMSTARPEQAEASYRKAAAIRQKLIDDHPEDVAYRSAWLGSRTASGFFTRESTAVSTAWPHSSGPRPSIGN